jgi:hypothetical protein
MITNFVRWFIDKRLYVFLCISNPTHGTVAFRDILCLSADGSAVHPYMDLCVVQAQSGLYLQNPLHSKGC